MLAISGIDTLDRGHDVFLLKQLEEEIVRIFGRSLSEGVMRLPPNTEHWDVGDLELSPMTVELTLEDPLAADQQSYQAEMYICWDEENKRFVIAYSRQFEELEALLRWQLQAELRSGQAVLRLRGALNCTGRESEVQGL